jgi:crossover junction endodeoxyribonuclease RuvC
MITHLLKLKTAPAYYDATDALAVAVCHSHRITHPRGGFKSWKSYAEANPERVLRSKLKAKS